MKLFLFFFFLIMAHTVSAAGFGVVPSEINVEEEPVSELILVNGEDREIKFVIKTNIPDQIVFEKREGLISAFGEERIEVEFKGGEVKKDAMIIVEANLVEKGEGIGIFPGVAIKVKGIPEKEQAEEIKVEEERVERNNNVILMSAIVVGTGSLLLWKRKWLKKKLEKKSLYRRFLKK